MAGTAIGPGWRTVGINTDHFGLHVRNVVLSRSRSAGVDRGDTWSHAHCVSSDIGNDASSESEDPAVAPGREFDMLDLIASMSRCEKALASTLDPGAGPSR